MKGKLRGVFIAHSDFQGDTPDAVRAAGEFAATITKAMRADFDKEVEDRQQSGQIDATAEAAALYAEFENHYKIKVVKVNL
jgi:hypothetical protein